MVIMMVHVSFSWPSVNGHPYLLILGTGLVVLEDSVREDARNQTIIHNANSYTSPFLTPFLFEHFHTSFYQDPIHLQQWYMVQGQ